MYDILRRLIKYFAAINCVICGMSSSCEKRVVFEFLFHFLFQTLLFSATNIHSFHQINALTNIRRLDNLTIDLDGNAITKYNLWRPYIVFRLAHFALKKINNIEVSLLSLSVNNHVSLILF